MLVSAVVYNQILLAGTMSTYIYNQIIQLHMEISDKILYPDFYVTVL